MDLKKKRVLVVGGAGFIGSHLIDQLECAELRVLDDFSTGAMENLKNSQHIELLEGDLRDSVVRQRALASVDVVFQLACRNVRHSIGQPRENLDVNAAGTLDLLISARQAGVERFVYVSSSEVYGSAQTVPMSETHPCRPETVYGASKLAAEACTRAFFRTYDFPTIVVRPFNNFGPRSHFEGDSGEVIPRFVVWALNDRPPVIFGDGQQTRDFIYVEETAHWLTKVAECDQLIGQTVNLGSGHETAIGQLAEIILDETGRSHLEPQFQPTRPGDVTRHCADTQLARESLDFSVGIGVREGIKRLIQYFRERYPDPRQLLDAVRGQNWESPQSS